MTLEEIEELCTLLKRLREDEAFETNDSLQRHAKGLLMQFYGIE